MLCFLHAQGDRSLQLTSPNERNVAEHDDVSRTWLETCRTLRRFSCVQAGKVRIDITVECMFSRLGWWSFPCLEFEQGTSQLSLRRQRVTSRDWEWIARLVKHYTWCGVLSWWIDRAACQRYSACSTILHPLVLCQGQVPVLIWQLVPSWDCNFPFQWLQWFCWSGPSVWGWWRQSLRPFVNLIPRNSANVLSRIISNPLDRRLTRNLSMSSRSLTANPAS